MLEGVRHLSLEAGPACNLASEHDWCPASVRPRSRTTLTPDVMVDVVEQAVALGFDGYVGFHYYNEPLLYLDVIRELLPHIRCRKMLWTNGLRLTQEVADLFDWVYVTVYPGHDYSHLDGLRHPRLNAVPATPDRRVSNYDGPARRRVVCWRPRVEVAVDHSCGVHLCCQDWAGVQGRVDEEPLEDILKRMAPALVSLMSDGMAVPDVCRTCKGPMTLDDYRRGC